MPIYRFVLAVALLLAAWAEAQEPPTADDPAAAVDAFHQALAAGDETGALGLLADDAVVFESGGAEMSRSEYAGHHLGPDMEFSAAVRATVVDRRVVERGDVAWVLSRTESRGTFRDREVALRGVETMVLERAAEGWRISHIHWSSRPLG